VSKALTRTLRPQCPARSRSGPAPAGSPTWKLLADQACEETQASGGGGAKAGIEVAAESRPVCEDRRGRTGGSSWVRRPRRTSECVGGAATAAGGGDGGGRPSAWLTLALHLREGPAPGFAAALARSWGQGQGRGYGARPSPFKPTWAFPSPHPIATCWAERPSLRVILAFAGKPEQPPWQLFMRTAEMDSQQGGKF
jgi:hypothetical protein